MTATTSTPTPNAPRVSSAEERLIVYQHSDLLYWWAVWGYGYFCAFMTWWHGKSVVLVEGGRPVLIFPRAWLGISFVLMTLFVLLFTNARARGLKSLVLFLTIAVVGLLVHMNLAYYLFFSTVLLIAWVFSIFVADRFVYWEFAPGGISKRVLFSEGSENFTTPQVETLRQSDDIFVHRVLGLWFLGFGTGDLDVRFGTPGGGQRIYHLKNVWRVGRVEREINRLVSRRAQRA
jgi:hypothetical protein